MYAQLQTSWSLEMIVLTFVCHMTRGLCSSHSQFRTRICVLFSPCRYLQAQKYRPTCLKTLATPHPHQCSDSVRQEGLLFRGFGRQKWSDSPLKKVSLRYFYATTASFACFLVGTSAGDFKKMFKIDSMIQGSFQQNLPCEAPGVNPPEKNLDGESEHFSGVCSQFASKAGNCFGGCQGDRQ